jgi:hypothetical protein
MKTDYEFSGSPCRRRLSQLPPAPAGAFGKTEKHSVWDLKPWPAGARFWALSNELICSDEEETQRMESLGTSLAWALARSCKKG